MSLEDFSQRANFPYLQGTYLAINALRDAVLVVDGPNCSFHKAEHIFGAHDIASTLLDVGGLHRVVHSDINVDRVITGHEQLVVTRLRDVARHESVGAAFVVALPMAALTGVDHREIADRVGEETGRKIYALPARSLERDWLDGYADFLVTLAREIDLPEPRPDPRKVAIVGYFMDRNEGDHRGNLSELGRLCEAVGLELVSVWLGGQRLAELARVQEAGLVVSLPHGRRAAALLADRLGARLITAPLPLGVDATSELVRLLGEAAGEPERAERVIERAMATIARPWEWLVLRRLVHRGLAYFGDPHLIPGLVELSSLLGMRLTALAACSRRRPIDEWAPPKPLASSLALSETRPGPSEAGEPAARGDAPAGPLPSAITWEPKIDALRTLMGAVGGETDLLVSNSWGLRWAGQAGPRMATLELGFPSRGYHASRESPFLGFEGALGLVDRIANALGDRCEQL